MVTRGYGGFYQVLQDDGAMVECKPRGRLKQEYDKIYPGDRVEISVLPDGTGMIESIGPRKTQLKRPQLVNFDRLVIVLAWKLPGYDTMLLDRLLVLAEEAGVDPVICINKLDLLTEDELPRFEALRDSYRGAGFTVLATSMEHPLSIVALRQELSSGLTVLAGPSGVGKSTLINLLLGREDIITGQVSERLRRGKHTTRYATIMPLGEGPEQGLIADTPGFFTLELPYSVTERDLPGFYPEFQLDKPCRFDGCLHLNEPDCAVKEAVEAGEIDEGRYRRYQRLNEEIKTREARY